MRNKPVSQTWPNCGASIKPSHVEAEPELVQLVRGGIVVDAVKGLVPVWGSGSAAVMTWSLAWISMVR
jgi:hypothetical protein